MKRLLAAIFLGGLLSLIPATPASAVVEQGWICHGTGSEGNPYVLLNVPLNSAHFEKHLSDGDDKLPNLVDENQEPYPPNLTCGEPGSEPTLPFTGKLTFALDTIACEGGTLVPGFTVTQEPGRRYFVQSFENGFVGEEVIFVFPPTCVPGATPQVVQQITATPVRQCRSRRVVTFRLPKQYRGLKRVRVKVGGTTQTLAIRNRKIKVSFVGRRPGIYAVVIRKKGKPRFDRLYALCLSGNVDGYNVP